MSRGKSRFSIGCIIKALLVIAVIMGGFFLFLTCSGGSCIQKIDQTLPNIKTVPWQISTVTNLYYSVNATENKDKSVTMTDWYEQVKGKWRFHKGNETLSAILQPKVSRR
jgi:hypothetical protein